MGLTDRRKTVEILAIGGELLIDRYNSIAFTIIFFEVIFF